MPLREVNHIHHIFGSMNSPLFMSISTPLSSTHPQTMLGTKRSPVSSRRTATSNILRTRHSLSSCFYIACAYGANNGASEELAKKSAAGGWSPRVLRKY
jgi:hypothetical protein